MEVECPGTWGTELLTPNQNTQKTQELALLATQPRAPPAMSRGPPGRDSPEQWGPVGNAIAPKGPDPRTQPNLKKSRPPYLSGQLTGALGKEETLCADI